MAKPVYRKKICPVCGKEHRNQKTYCSGACRNAGRGVTQRQRDNMREVSNEYHDTPEGIAHLKLRGKTFKKNQKLEQENKPLIEQNAEDYAIEIPTVTDIHDYDDFLTNFDKAEKW